MKSDDDLIKAIVSAPGNDAPRRQYADWLKVQGDPRSGYLHAEMEWAKTKSAEAETRLRRLAREFDPVWIARVSRPPVGICADHVRFHEPGPKYVRPALQPSHLAWIEKRFGITLPADYQAFMLNYNGGRPEPEHYRLTDRTYEPWRYELLMGLGVIWAARDSEIAWWEDDVVWNLQELEEWRRKSDSEAKRWSSDPHRHFMIIGFGPPDGELEMVCLGCGGDVLGQVFRVTPYIWSDDEEIEDYRLVAPSFAAFLAMLTDYDPDHVKAIKVADLAALRRWLDAGGDPNERYRAQQLIDYGFIYRQSVVVRELLARGAEIRDGLLMEARQLKNRELFELVRGRCQETLERVLSDKPDPNIRFGDLRTILSHRGFYDMPVAPDNINVDHHLFWRDGVAEILNLQPRNGLAKPYQFKQVRDILTRYNLIHAAYGLVHKINIEEEPLEP